MCSIGLVLLLPNFSISFSMSSHETIISVSDLNRQAARLLENHFPLMWISGEISNFTRAASGHWYFSLKDSGAQVRGVMFRGRAQHVDFQPKEGDRVEVRATVTLYEARGDYQLSVEGMRRAGLGNLYEAFLKLKAKLEAEGLFEPERKRPIPRFPKAIGIVTSLQAAALRDILTALARRAPHIPLIIYPAPVQGADAADKIAKAIQIANTRAEVDVLLVCRGGGSIEDLWSFNEEVVARALVASQIPVIAGVGHETDFTIADFVADLRAPTPTAAAELATPARDTLLAAVQREQRALSLWMMRSLQQRMQRLDAATRRLQPPSARVAEQRRQILQWGHRLQQLQRARLADAVLRWQRLSHRYQRSRPNLAPVRQQVVLQTNQLRQQMQRNLQRQQAQLSELSAKLALLNPQKTLERGYAIVQLPDGRVVRKPADIKAGGVLAIRLAKGQVSITTGAIQPELGGDQSS